MSTCWKGGRREWMLSSQAAISTTCFGGGIDRACQWNAHWQRGGFKNSSYSVGFSSLKVIVFAEMGKTRGKIRFRKDNQGFCFHQVDFNILIKHGRGDGVVKYRSMRF